MGIKDLNPFIKAHVPEAIETIHLKELSGKKVAIDTSIYFYKFLYRNDRYIESFFLQISKLVRWGIIPIYVFDGSPPKEKSEEIQQRITKKNQIKDKIEALNHKLNNENVDNPQTIYMEISKLKKKLIYVKSEYIVNLKYFLDLLNIKYIQANSEADSLCSKLNEKGIVDMVLSDDMDLLTSGTRILLRDYCNTSNNISKYNLNKIFEKLEIDYDMWVDFCILCGCDYSKRIKGLGPNSIYKYIKEYKCIEKIIENTVGEGKKFASLPNIFNYEKARQLFKNCDYFKEHYNDMIVCIEPLFGNQIEAIESHLKKNTQLSDKVIKNRLEIIYKL